MQVAIMRPAVGVAAKVLTAIQFLSRKTLLSGERMISTGGSKVTPPLVERLSNTALVAEPNVSIHEAKAFVCNVERL